MENVFEKFNKEFFKGVKNIDWFDKIGIMDLNDGRLVIIKIDDNGTRDHFNGYWVEILSKTSGTVYKQFFNFKRHLHFFEKHCHAWLMDGNLKWYIETPQSTKPMVNMILNFIEKFK